MNNLKNTLLVDPNDQFRVYLPKKGADGWKDTNNLFDQEIITHYGKTYGDMDILNLSTFKDCIDNKDDKYGKYDPIDAYDRHPASLYLVPGVPCHRSNSLTRS